ncbi:hypothetical protein BD779DRAFT_1496027 [Infundibulicybe gibba]|nr:hypothetical protein BD779DRAFT_1496027 [Infundibulicybe gibba]
MFSTLLTIALFAAPALRGVFADFTVDTPEFVQCQDAKLSWQATKGPYNAILVAPTNPCVRTWDHNGNTMTYKVAFPAGTKLQLSIADGDEDEGWSGEITVKASDDTSCLPANLKADTNKDQASSASSSDPAPTTLVIKPTTTPAAATPSSSSGAPAPVGAANAGKNPLDNSAPASHRAATPLIVFSAVMGVFAFCL